MAEPKLKSFRWLGTPGVGGCLTVRSVDRTKVRIVSPAGPTIRKSCLVREHWELEGLGAARIQEIVDSGAGEYVNIVEGLLDALGHDDGQELRDSREATELAQGVADEWIGIETRARLQRLAQVPPEVDATLPGLLTPEGADAGRGTI